MKHNRAMSVAIVAFSTSLAASSAQAAGLKQAGKAKLVLQGGRIHTSNGVLEAMAVDDQGVIVAVGSGQDLEQYRTEATRIIDLEGLTVLPGFHDLHVHPVYAGLRAQECVIAQGSSLAETQRRVKECAAEAQPGEWVTGGQWDASAIGQVPTRQMLDAAAPNNPVVLRATSGHSSWTNTKALEVAGIGKATPDPEGGIVERDAAGNPSGVFRELAMELIYRHVPPRQEEDYRRALKWSLDQMLSYGITSFTEASADLAAVRAYVALADAGALKQRTRLCLRWRPGSSEAEALIAARNLHARDRIAPDCVKIVVDGVPTDSHTAAMLEPYSGAAGGREDEASRKGLLLVDQKTLQDAAVRFDRMGLTVKFHAAGDAAVRASLNAIEAARQAHGFSGRLHDVAHCTFVAKADIARARAMAATFEVSPYLWAPSPINESITAAVGDRRMDRVWPVREMIESGALVIPGSDWSVVPSVDPWIGVETLITREVPGGGEKSFGKAQAITLDQAMAMFTVNAARHMEYADKVGNIAPGMLADVIVVNQDPYETPTQRLHKTTVLKTIINGEVVYER